MFNLRRPESLVPVLAELERCLQVRKACYWTAEHLVQHNATVGKAIFELRAGSHLLAVADMKGEVAVWPKASEKDFEQAVWKHKARKTVAIPQEFERYSLAQLIWQYTTRTNRKLLPKRYRECDIFFRRPPRVDPQLIEDTHLLVMRELALGPCTLAELQTRMGAAAETSAVEAALASLYFVGSITSNPERASHTSGRGGLTAIAPQAVYGNERQIPDTRPTTAPLI